MCINFSLSDQNFRYQGTKKWFLLILATGFTFAGTAQEKKDYQTLEKKYRDDNALYVHKNEAAEIEIEKGKPVIYSKIEEEILILNDKASGYSDRPIYYSSFSEIDDIKAQTIALENGKEVSYKVKNITTTNEISGGSFYDDYKAKHVVFSNVKKGSRIQLSYVEKTIEPRFFGRFHFNASIPTDEATFSVKVSKGVNINYKLFSAEGYQINFTKEEKKKYTLYTWTAKEIKKYTAESDGPTISYYTPHVVVYITSFETDTGTQNLLSGTDGLYAWYRTMVKDVNTKEDAELKKTVDSLTQGVTDEFEKVKKIFYWVQDNIKYVAFEDGMGGFVPREAALVCSKRYGDCKDMASIITTMLTIAKIPSYMTWIGTRHIPYSYNDVPSPISDNHMIAAYKRNDTYYFLDATGKNASIDMYTSMIQGKEALVGINDTKYEVVKVPEIPKEKNVWVDTLNIKLNGTFIKGKAKAYSSGYEKIILSDRLQHQDEKEQKKFLTAVMEKGSNKFKADSFQLENLHEREKQLIFQYNFELGDYAKENGKELYINLHLDKGYMNELLDPEVRTVPLEIEFKNIERNVVVLDIPAGYKALYIPENSSYKNEKFGFDIRYRQENNKIYLERTLYIDTLMVATTDFEEWNKMIRKLTKAYNESVSLTKK